MTTAKVVLNSPAVAALLKGGGNVDLLVSEAGGKALGAAGEGHELRVTVGRSRIRATVITTTFEAIRREAEDHTLTAALDAARG